VPAEGHLDRIIAFAPKSLVGAFGRVPAPSSLPMSELAHIREGVSPVFR